MKTGFCFSIGFAFLVGISLSSCGRGYLNLGDAPARVPPPLSPAEVAQEFEDLQKDNTSAQSLIKEAHFPPEAKPQPLKMNSFKKQS